MQPQTTEERGYDLPVNPIELHLASLERSAIERQQLTPLQIFEQVRDRQRLPTEQINDHEVFILCRRASSKPWSGETEEMVLVAHQEYQHYLQRKSDSRYQLPEWVYRWRDEDKAAGHLCTLLHYLS